MPHSEPPVRPRDPEAFRRRVHQRAAELRRTRRVALATCMATALFLIGLAGVWRGVGPFGQGTPGAPGAAGAPRATRAFVGKTGGGAGRGQGRAGGRAGGTHRTGPAGAGGDAAGAPGAGGAGGSAPGAGGAPPSTWTEGPPPTTEPGNGSSPSTATTLPSTTAASPTAPSSTSTTTSTLPRDGYDIPAGCGEPAQPAETLDRAALEHQLVGIWLACGRPSLFGAYPGGIQLRANGTWQEVVLAGTGQPITASGPGTAGTWKLEARAALTSFPTFTLVLRPAVPTPAVAACVALPALTAISPQRVVFHITGGPQPVSALYVRFAGSTA